MLVYLAGTPVIRRTQEVIKGSSSAFHMTQQCSSSKSLLLVKLRNKFLTRS